MDNLLIQPFHKHVKIGKIANIMKSTISLTYVVTGNLKTHRKDRTKGLLFKL